MSCSAAKACDNLQRASPGMLIGEILHSAASPSSEQVAQVTSLPHSHTRMLSSMPQNQLPAPDPLACTVEASQGSGRMQFAVICILKTE